MEVKCANCQKLLRIPDTAVGKNVKCPLCNQSFLVPKIGASGAIKNPVDEKPKTLSMSEKTKPPEKPKTPLGLTSVEEKPSSEELNLQPKTMTPVGVKKSPTPVSMENPSLTSTPESPPSTSTGKASELIALIGSYKQDIEKGMKERDEAMEMVDGFFQMFLNKANNPSLSPQEQKEYRDIADKLFQLQKKFPLLSGFLEILNKCEQEFQSRK